MYIPPFQVTVDELAHALLNGDALTANCPAHTTMADAHKQARMMIAGPALVDALYEVLPFVPGHNECDWAGRPHLVRAIAALRAAGQ